MRKVELLWLIWFWFDAGQSHFNTLVRKHNTAVFSSASAFVVAILIEAILTVITSVVACCAFVNISTALSVLDILVSTGADADKASVKITAGDVLAADSWIQVAFVDVLAVKSVCRENVAGEAGADKTRLFVGTPSIRAARAVDTSLVACLKYCEQD